jgi:hypothetical protein
VRVELRLSERGQDHQQEQADHATATLEKHSRGGGAVTANLLAEEIGSDDVTSEAGWKKSAEIVTDTINFQRFRKRNLAPKLSHEDPPLPTAHQ